MKERALRKAEERKKHSSPGEVEIGSLDHMFL